MSARSFEMFDLLHPDSTSRGFRQSLSDVTPGEADAQ
jgi:hypothetical protein